jgi:hypothetical protein
VDVLVATLSAWIVIQTGLATVAPPNIVFVEQDRLVQSAAGAGAVGSSQIRALYRQSDRTIFLRSNWDAASLNDRSELVHELVHHFQNAHDLKYGCDAEREELAYKLQMTWLRENGVQDPYEFLELNAFSF